MFAEFATSWTCRTPGTRYKIRNLFALIGLLAASYFAVVGAAVASYPFDVWFGPAGSAIDVNEIFKSPERWPIAKERINAIEFSAGQLGQHPELLVGLQAVDAFRKPREWRIDISQVAPSVKEWDCSGRVAAKVTNRILSTLNQNGGAAQFLETDEPLASGLAQNSCHLTIAEVATRMAQYVSDIKVGDSVKATHAIPRFVDIEAYPNQSVAEIEAWIEALERNNVHLDGLNLDVNVHYVDIHPHAKVRLDDDLRELKDFLHRNKVLFGIIIWSGLDPERSDKDYYEHALAWSRTVHKAIGYPDRLIFTSWVRRYPHQAQCLAAGGHLGTPGETGCVGIGVPRNLPERTGSHTQTQLIIDATNIFLKSTQ